MDVWLLFVLLAFAAILGNTVNYSIGHYIGPRVFRADTSGGRFDRLLNRQHLDRAHAFFEKYGGMAVVLTRFVPIIRTFVPFVAGAGAMRYPVFALYNIAGGALWVGICVGAGYAFGNVPVVKENFSLVAIGIVLVSVIPVVIEFLKHKSKGQRV
jgi:membrane-associated protein